MEETTQLWHLNRTNWQRLAYLELLREPKNLKLKFYSRPGLGEFWPEDIDVELCDVIYYGFGNILNDTYEVCSWDPWFDLSMEIDGPDGTIANCVQARIYILLHLLKPSKNSHCFYDSRRGMETPGFLAVSLSLAWTTVTMMESGGRWRSRRRIPTSRCSSQ